MSRRAEVALVHDYLTQRGGAERVALALTRAFPEATLTTSLYDPAGTFPEFAGCHIATLPIDRLAGLRTHHRLALPLLAPAFSAHRIDAAVTVCSSSGWAHGVRATGAKLVYCHNPARWLYQRADYLGTTGRGARWGLAALAPMLAAWDRRAAAGATRYLANSTVVRDRIRRAYGIDAEVVPPPVTVDRALVDTVPTPVPGPYALCVGRLLPYKHVDAVVEAFRAQPALHLAVVGGGPGLAGLRAAAPANVHVLGEIDDAELLTLYAHAEVLVAASVEDFGLTPLEAAHFGVPAVTLRFGGFLDSVEEGVTGVMFDRPEPAAIRAAVSDAVARKWDRVAIRAHAERFSFDAFAGSVRAHVEELARSA